MRTMIVALTMLASGSAAAAPMICVVDQQYECSREGCRPGRPGNIHKLIDRERQVYSRCDDMGCDDFPASFTTTGPFTNIVFADGTLAKLSPDITEPRKLHLVEVVTLGVIALVSYATCFEVIR